MLWVGTGMEVVMERRELLMGMGAVADDGPRLERRAAQGAAAE